jgi:predicted phosphodiesterase
MRIAVIADVHANLAALNAVLADIERRDVGEIVCLGDIVGYNAQPRECIRLVGERCDVVVKGNHDVACVNASPDPGTNPVAATLQRWTRSVLEPDDVAYLSTLPNVWVDPAGFVAAHACYLNEHFYTGYVTSTMLEANFDALRARAGWPGIAFCGHTHTQMCAWRRQGTVTEIGLRDVEMTDGSRKMTVPVDADTVLVNPGAVGQSRDGDPRAGYAVFDLVSRSLLLCRVDYDVESTCRELLAAGLPVELAARLREGR